MHDGLQLSKAKTFYLRASASLVNDVMVDAWTRFIQANLLAVLPNFNSKLRHVCQLVPLAMFQTPIGVVFALGCVRSGSLLGPPLAPKLLEPPLFSSPA